MFFHQCYPGFSCFSEFASRNPELFARFIPNVLPPTRPQDLPGLIEQTQQLQQSLVTNEGYSRWVPEMVCCYGDNILHSVELRP